MKNAIKTQAIISTISSRRDGSARVSFETPELESDEFSAFRELQGINLEAYFKPMDFVVKDIKEIKSEVDTKTPSQRLRAVLFVLYDQEGRPGEFSEYYSKKMEKMIDFIKDKLD